MTGIYYVGFGLSYVCPAPTTPSVIC